MPVLSEANQEAVRVFDYVYEFLGQNLELPSCLPWIFEVLDVGSERVILEKILVILDVVRVRQNELEKQW